MGQSKKVEDYIIEKEEDGENTIYTNETHRI